MRTERRLRDPALVQRGGIRRVPSERRGNNKQTQNEDEENMKARLAPKASLSSELEDFYKQRALQMSLRGVAGHPKRPDHPAHSVHQGSLKQ